MKKIVPIICATAILVASTVSGCAPDSAQTQTNGGQTAAKNTTLRMTWWGSQTRHDMTVKMLNMFMAQNPAIKVEYEFTGQDQYWDKMSSMAAANNLPDVYQNSIAYILSYVNKNQIADLNPYIADGTINLTEWDDVFKKLGVINGSTYGLTLGNSAYAVLYDPEMLKTAGVAEPTLKWTWDDYAKSLKQIKDKTGAFGDSQFAGTMIEGYQMFLRQNGLPGVFNSTRDGLAYSNTDLWVKFHNMQKQLIVDGLVMPYDQTLPTMKSVELTGVATGKAAFLGITNSNQAVAASNAKKSPLGITSFPHAVGEKQPGNFIGPTMFLSIPKSSKAPKESAKLMNFMLNDVEANKIALMEKGVPANKSLRSAIEPLLTPTGKSVSQYVGEIAKIAVPYDVIYPTAYAEVNDLYNKLVADMLFGKISVEDAGKKFNADAEVMLKNGAKK